MLTETEIELGPNGAKTKSPDGRIGKVQDLGNKYYSTYRKIIAYLKQKNLLAKIASKENYDSEDITFMGNGDVLISFDDGGSIRVPGRVIEAQVQPAQQKGFLSGLKKKLAACVDLNENYFDY